MIVSNTNTHTFLDIYNLEQFFYDCTLFSYRLRSVITTTATKVRRYAAAIIYKIRCSHHLQDTIYCALKRNDAQQASVTKKTSAVYETLRYIIFYHNRYGVLFSSTDVEHLSELHPVWTIIHHSIC
jgi:hypothetical protein